jgi:uncharacterized protein (DUF2141 family)
MKVSATVFNKGSTKITLEANAKTISALEHALYIVKVNQNTEGDPLANKQSVQAYKALKELFNILGIEA